MSDPGNNDSRWSDDTGAEEDWRPRSHQHKSARSENSTGEFHQDRAGKRDSRSYEGKNSWGGRRGNNRDNRRGGSGFSKREDSYEGRGQRKFGRNGNKNRRDDRRDDTRGTYREDNRRNRQDNRDGRERNYRGNKGNLRQGSGPRRNEPPLPAEVSAKELDREAFARLRSLKKEVADETARHLVMAGRLLDLDAEASYAHAQAALARAWRVDIVREACALSAYATGRYAEALREIRTARRLSGMDVLCSVEADCERALGRHDKALEIINRVDPTSIDDFERIELLLVASGVRHEMGDDPAALSLVEEALELVDKEDVFLLRRVLSVKVDRLRENGKTAEADQLETEIPEEPIPADIIDIEASDAELAAQSPTVLRGADKPLNEIYKNLLVDLDGVTYLGDKPIENAAESLKEAANAGGSICYVTNNAARPPQHVVDKLASVGISATVEQVYTAALDGVETLVDKLPPGAKVLAIGGEGVFAALRDAGFEIVESAEDKPAAVLQGLGFEVSWKELSEAAYAVNDGALFVGTNGDASLPTSRGFAVGNGSLIAAVENATGKRALLCGKPFPEIYLRARKRLGEGLCLAIGDRLDTDVVGAKEAKIPSLLVLTGVTKPRDVVLAPPTQRPEFVGLDLSDLLRDSERPRLGEYGWWTCEGRHARIRHGRIEIRGLEEISDGTEISLAEFKALCAAAWYVREQGGRVDCPHIVVKRDIERSIPEDEESNRDGNVGEEESVSKIEAGVISE